MKLSKLIILAIGAISLTSLSYAQGNSQGAKMKGAAMQTGKTAVKEEKKEVEEQVKKIENKGNAQKE